MKTLYKFFSFIPNLLKICNRRITVKINDKYYIQVVESIKTFRHKGEPVQFSFYDELLRRTYSRDRPFYQISNNKVLFVNPRRTGVYTPFFTFVLIYSYEGNYLHFEVSSLLKYSSKTNIIFFEFLPVNVLLFTPIVLGILLPIIDPIPFQDYIQWLIIPIVACLFLGLIYYFVRLFTINRIIRLLISEIQKNYEIEELKEELINWNNYFRE